MAADILPHNSENNFQTDVLDIPSICITSLWRQPFNVIFRVGVQQTRFYCHKEVLRANSTKFAKELRETHETLIIEVPDISKEAFQTVVRYIYNSDLAVKYSYVVETMIVANRYEFKSMKKALLDFAKHRTDYTSAITLFKQFQSVSDDDEPGLIPLKELALQTIDKYGLQ
ncbi:BTB/POZ domain-containing protein 2-like protein, partial [Leptotrombidium deliense]